MASYLIGLPDESSEDLHNRFLSSINATEEFEEKTAETYEELSALPPDFSGGHGALVAIATPETPGVRVEDGAPVAVQVVETGHPDDLHDMMDTVPLPTMLVPPCTWIPLFPKHSDIHPSNPDFAPTVEAVLRAFVDHQSTVTESVESALKHAEQKLAELQTQRTPGYRAPDIIKRKGLASSYSCSHALMVCVADHRPLPPQDKRPLIMFLGGSTDKDLAQKLIERYVKEGNFSHVVRGVPARTWFSPQLLYLRRLRENDVSVMARSETQEFMKLQKELIMRDEDGKTFIQKANEVNDLFGEAGGAPDGDKAAGTAETEDADGGADGAAQGEGGGA